MFWWLIAGASCPSETARQSGVRPPEQGDGIVLFLTGSELGALKPCGCSGGQLGGLSKRALLFHRVPATNRMVVDTGALVAGDREQDLIKFRVLFRAYRLLGYDVVNLTGADVEIGRSLGLLDARQWPFAIISADWGADQDDRPRSVQKRFSVRGHDVRVQIATFDARSDAAASAAELFGSRPGDGNVNILILQNSDAETRLIWARGAGAHCLVCPMDSDDPRQLSEPGADPLIIAPGRLGRHVVRLQVDFDKSLEGIGLRFSDVPVDETLPEDEALVELYKQYQEFVSESRLLEAYPRLPLPDDLSYVGSENCAACHDYEYSRWRTRAHADAMATLVKVGSDRDPECVICHVVGMDYSSGYINAEQTPGLKDVGCENCHGPGSEHVRTAGQTPTGEPKTTCLDCHTPEHSGGYAGHEAEFLEKIVHWREP